MITPTEAEQLVNEARKRADRSAEVETIIDAAITQATSEGRLADDTPRSNGWLTVLVPAELEKSIEPAIARYRGVGWTVTVGGVLTEGIRVALTIVRRRAGEGF